MWPFLICIDALVQDTAAKIKICRYSYAPFLFFFYVPLSFYFFSFFKFYFIFKLYNIVLVLPNIKMNLPQVHLCSPSWTLLPPPSPYPPSGSSQCTSPKHPVSCIEPGLHFLKVQVSVVHQHRITFLKFMIAGLCIPKVFLSWDNF